jgi:hypothetical protein
MVLLRGGSVFIFSTSGYQFVFVYVQKHSIDNNFWLFKGESLTRGRLSDRHTKKALAMSLQIDVVLTRMSLGLE